MKTKLCSVCRKEITLDEPAVLAMSPIGAPKYLCEECEAAFERATASRDPDEITAAIDEIGTIIKDANNDDDFILATVGEIINSANERAGMIREGLYDFKEEEEAMSEENEEVPEELLELEEDRELDRREEESKKRFDKIVTYISIPLFAIFIALMIYFIVKMFI